jgi:hypothetical protein
VDGVENTGVDDSLTDVTGAVTPTSNLNIGRRPSNNRFAKGFIDDVRIYNRVLSPDEIKRLYKIGGTVKIGTSMATDSLSRGLVGWWTFDAKDVSGSVTGTTPRQMYDRSGNSNVGKYWNATGSPPVIGKLGQALSFDGVDDHIIMLDATSLKPNNISVSLWVKFTKLDKGRQDIFGKWSNSNGYGIDEDENNGQLTWWMSIGGTWYDVNYASSNLSTNKWYHIVGTYDGETSIMYIDGVKQGQNTSPSGNMTQVTVAPLIGGNTTCMCQMLPGTIDDLRIFNRALSADEVKRLYKIGGTVKIGTSMATDSLSKGLVGWWTFDGKDMAGNYAFDKSGNGNRGTLTGTNGVPVRTIGKIGQGLSFDGVDDYVSTATGNSIKGATQATISMWIKPVALGSSAKALYTEPRNTDGSLRWTLSITNSLVDMLVRIPDSAGNSFSLASASQTFSNGLWYHVVGVFDSVTDLHHVYINGVDNKTVTAADSFDNTNPNQNPRIGTDFGTANFPGLIDDVRIYNRALSADEVKRLYNMGR